MKKFVLLAVIATMACGIFAIDYTLEIGTNQTPGYTFDVYRNLGYTATTLANGDRVAITSTNVSNLVGLYTIDPAPAGYFWDDTSSRDVKAIYFTPTNNYTWTLTWNLYSFEDNTPVELSSFTATLTALNDVQINWTTQSETDLLGYRVYRNETSIQNDAQTITPILISATNSSQQQNYTVVDKEVETGHTYFYWLESVEMNSSHFFGPVGVNVQGEVPPVNPQISVLKNAYPNPFRANTSTSIGVDMKDGEHGTVTIYNLQGKIVKAYDVQPGSHTINWNGTDSNNNACSSGIYLYKLSAPSVNQTKKMVIIK